MAVDLTVLQWVALLLGAFCFGFSKTAIAGLGAIGVAVYAAILPAKESTGVVLPLLIVADAVAVLTYRRHTDWSPILRILPSTILGILIGCWVLDKVDNLVARRMIGLILLFLSGMHFLRIRMAAGPIPTPGPALGFILFNLLGLTIGVTTMIANAAGPLFVLYLLAAGFVKLAFLGTMGWFFFIVNVMKVPFSINLGLIDAESLLFNILLIPAVLAGTAVGTLSAQQIPQKTFERVSLGFTILAGLKLVLE
jgi:uncharacterized protein